METSPDKQEIQDGVEKFIEWIKADKLEIRVYPHALKPVEIISKSPQLHSA